MSTQEIIAELTHLTRPELEAIDARVHELLRAPGADSHLTWGEALLKVAGAAQGLPADMAHNHDHYLHGAPRK